MPFFSKVFKRDGASKSRKNADLGKDVAPPKPRWEEAWSRKEVAPAEVQELIHECTQEMKSRALDMPFLLLPFRPGSDPVGSKSFIRNFFKVQYEGTWKRNKHVIEQELRLLDPLVLCSIMKWCWSRLPGGVVTWETYDLFRAGENDSQMAKNAFTVFIPMSTESEARKRIIFDFFDLLAAIAARGKTNGLGGRKLSRMAGWWAFEHSDQGKGFDGGYHSWANAADATSHLFFAYLRSLSPDATGGVSGISQLPRSLQALLSQTEYPPETPTLMLTTTPKVVMIVNTVSPTPFALLRRARNFEYRDDDEALQQFSEYDDPVQALTDECRRVLGCISSTNQSVIPSNNTTAVSDGAWSRFEDMGFSNIAESLQSPGDLATTKDSNGLRSGASSRVDDLGRPTTPSWADFLSSGFPDDRSPTLLPPDKSLPLPVSGPPRGHSSQSHVRHGLQDHDLEPGELASINQLDLDETFWWVWMTSLAGEETPDRKAVFGRCALIETQIPGAHWLVIEEQIKGASPGQEEGVYIAEKKSRFSWTKRGRLSRRKTMMKKTEPKVIEEPHNRSKAGTPASRIAPEQQAKIKDAAARLKDQKQQNGLEAQRRSRLDDSASQKTNSVLTLQPAIMNEAAPAMKWAKDFDKEVIRAAYLGDPSAGTGRSKENLGLSTSAVNLNHTNGSTTLNLRHDHANRDLPSLPKEQESPVQRKPFKSPSPPTTPPRKPSDDLTPEPERHVPTFDEKPKLDNIDQHPAFRTQESPESSKKASPEAAGLDQRRLQKKDAAKSTGLKNLFSRKKPEPVTGSKPPNEVHNAPHKLHKSPPKSIPIQVPQYKEPTPEPSVVDTSPAQSLSRHMTNQEDTVPTRNYTPPIGAREQLAADSEFSRFDQGPLDDLPAFVPEETPESSVAATSPPAQSTHFPVRAPAPLHSQAELPSVQASKIPPAPESKTTVDDESEDSDDVPPQGPQASDRWAQIRKNAAERAQRMNEEQSGRSRSQSGKTDEGDTSGEETIESRVARIKARVAELTGNMEGQGAAPGAKK